MSCIYMEYNKDEIYYPYLYCNIDGNRCIYAKKCEKEERFIPNGNLWEECYKMITNLQKDIPNGSYYVQTVRPNKKGNLFLYVVINDKVEKIQTELTEMSQNYVYLKEGIDGYQVSLVPFVEKKTYTNKKTKKYE